MAGVAGRSGGAREGAGRKSKQDKYATAIGRAEKRIADRLPQIIDNLLSLSDGVYVEEMGLDGERRVYQRPPCAKSSMYLADRIMGKPTTVVDQDTTVRLDPLDGADLSALLEQLRARGIVVAE